MRSFIASLGFAFGGLTIVAVVMAIEIYIGGYTYRNTPPLGNFIFGVIIFMPYLLCAAVGFAIGLRVFRVTTPLVPSFILGAAFVAAIGFLYWAFDLKPFDASMISHGALIGGLAIPSALLARVLARSRREPRAGS